jgi:dTDP-4-amino-4,6-dideoxygalactose transaminase
MNPTSAPIVPFQNLPLQTQELRSELDPAIANVLGHCQFILGGEVSDFENSWADYCATKYAIGVGSGTDALQLILRALGIGRGDEVITVTNSFIATAEAISYTGAKPVLVDCDPKYYLIDTDAVAHAITPQTRAIIPVHLYGQPANMDALGVIAAKHGLPLIEDAAQAHGATLRDGRRCGAVGIAAGFSFYPGKNLGAFGDGGAVTTSDSVLAQQLRLLRNWGSVVKYHHEIQGYNSRLDTLQAAVLGVKLRHLERWNTHRRTIAQWYRERLADMSGITLPSEARWTGQHAYHLFVVKVEGYDRDRFMDELRARGVQAVVHYPIPIHRQKAYADLNYASGRFPVSEHLATRIVSLPMFPEMTREQCDFVCDAIRAILK